MKCIRDLFLFYTTKSVWCIVHHNEFLMFRCSRKQLFIHLFGNEDCTMNNEQDLTENKDNEQFNIFISIAILTRAIEYL